MIESGPSDPVALAAGVASVPVAKAKSERRASLVKRRAAPNVHRRQSGNAARGGLRGVPQRPTTLAATAATVRLAGAAAGDDVAAVPVVKAKSERRASLVGDQPLPTVTEGSTGTPPRAACTTPDCGATLGDVPAEPVLVAGAAAANGVADDSPWGTPSGSELM